MTIKNANTDGNKNRKNRDEFRDLSPINLILPMMLYFIEATALANSLTNS
jgi:hypothetical protein